MTGSGEFLLTNRARDQSLAQAAPVPVPAESSGSSVVGVGGLTIFVTVLLATEVSSDAESGDGFCSGILQGGRNTLCARARCKGVVDDQHRIPRTASIDDLESVSTNPSIPGVARARTKEGTEPLGRRLDHGAHDMIEGVMFPPACARDRGHDLEVIGPCLGSETAFVGLYPAPENCGEAEPRARPG